MAGSQIPAVNVAGNEDMASSKRFGEIEEEIDDMERAFQKFENFEILDHAPSDHSFLSNRILNKLGARRSALIQSMKLEWEDLKLCLAKSSIYVRAYEQRPDLMRAVLVGPEGTPYHHALFCFDIRFPSTYPTQPPDLFYRSYDHPSNPTSHTKGNLKGFLNLKIKSCSTPMTVLQLLTLIQHSFLTNKPNKTLRLPGGGPNTRVMKQTCEAMLCMLKSPPQDFEVFVQGYFRTRAHQILMNFKFRIGLDETTMGLFFRLVRAFEANGTYCQHHCNKDSFDLALVKEMRPRQKSANPIRKLSTILQATFL